MRKEHVVRIGGIILLCSVLMLACAACIDSCPSFKYGGQWRNINDPAWRLEASDRDCAPPGPGYVDGTLCVDIPLVGTKCIELDAIALFSNLNFIVGACTPDGYCLGGVAGAESYNTDGDGFFDVAYVAGTWCITWPEGAEGVYCLPAYASEWDRVGP